MAFRSFRVPMMVAGVLVLSSIASFADEFPQVRTDRQQIMPTYPEDAQRTGKTGTAIIAVQVNEIGKPFNVQLATSSGSEALDKAALGAVRTWRFVPAEKDGMPAAEWTAVGIQFGPDGVKVVPVSPDTEISRKDREQTICRKQPPVTGSLLPPGQLCLAKWQWEERARRAKAQDFRFPQNPGGGAKGSGK